MTVSSGRGWSIGGRLLLAGVLALSLLGGGVTLRAQSPGAPAGSTLFAGTTDSAAFPAVSMSLFAVDPAGLPILSLPPSAFVVTENGAPVASERLTLREQTDTPLDLVVALDRSTDATSWASVQRAAFSLLEQLRAGDEVALIAYAEGVEVLAAPTQELTQVRTALSAAVPGGALNALNLAVAQGLELLGPDEGRRRALVVIADSANDVTAETGANVQATDLLAQIARGQGAAIQPMGYGAAAIAPDLAQMAAQTGGRFVPATSAPDLIGHAQVLPSLLRQGYAISYRSMLPADGAQIVLGVALGGSPPVERLLVAQPGAVVVQITRPSDGQTVSGQVVIGLSAQAPAPLAGVTFALDDGEIITSTTGPVSGIIWDSAAATPGQRRISVTAQDTAGNLGVDEVELFVRSPLTLRVVAPAQSVQVGATALVTAYVESAFSSPVVELFVGRTQVGMKANPANPIVFEVDTSAFAPGSYAITVRAANSGGFTASDNGHVLTIAPPPATVSRNATAVMEQGWQMLGRLWPWLALALAALGALALAYWLARRLQARAQQRERERAVARSRLVPQVRMVLTNTGNTRTRYRLLAQDASGELRFTFLLDGIPLQSPSVARVERMPVAANGGATVAAPAPVTAANGAPAPFAAVGAAAQGAGQVAGLAGQLMAGLGQVLPGAAGDQARQMAGGIRAQQGAVARADFQVKDTMDDMRDVSAVSGQIKNTAIPQSAAAQPAAQPAARPAPRPAVAPPSADFALQGPAGAPIETAPPVWVLTPPLPPGDTISIDIHIASARRLGRNKEVRFVVLSSPLDQESAPPARDEVSVRLNTSR